jgi:hypothetical protein
MLLGEYVTVPITMFVTALIIYSYEDLNPEFRKAAYLHAIAASN